MQTTMRSLFLQGSSSRVAARTTPVRMFAQRLQRVTRRGMVVKVCISEAQQCGRHAQLLAA